MNRNIQLTSFQFHIIVPSKLTCFIINHLAKCSSFSQANIIKANNSIVSYRRMFGYTLPICIEIDFDVASLVLSSFMQKKVIYSRF